MLGLTWEGRAPTFPRTREWLPGVALWTAQFPLWLVARDSSALWDGHLSESLSF
jgi:hypothetical protein